MWIEIHSRCNKEQKFILAVPYYYIGKASYFNILSQAFFITLFCMKANLKTFKNLSLSKITWVFFRVYVVKQAENRAFSTWVFWKSAKTWVFFDLSFFGECEKKAWIKPKPPILGLFWPEFFEKWQKAEFFSTWVFLASVKKKACLTGLALCKLCFHLHNYYFICQAFSPLPKKTQVEKNSAFR